MKTLSIIVPSYNTERYINDCLPKLIPKSNFFNDLEILIVNDGSTDATLGLAKKFEREYPTVIKVLDKDNGGHGSTINVGIKNCSGKYFKVIDGDDWVITKNLEKLIVFLKTTNSDLVANPFYFFNEKNKRSSLSKENRGGSQFGKNILFEQIGSYKRTFRMHELTFKTSILKKSNFKLDEHCFYVDAEYVIYPIPFVDFVTILDFPVYVYRVNSDFQSINIKNAIKNISQHEQVLDSLLVFSNENKTCVNSFKKKYIEYHVSRIANTQYNLLFAMEISSTNKKIIIDLDKKIKNENINIYEIYSNMLVRVFRLSNYKMYSILSIIAKLRLKLLQLSKKIR